MTLPLPTVVVVVVVVGVIEFNFFIEGGLSL